MENEGYPIALLITKDELKIICSTYDINMQRLLNRARASMERLTEKDIKELMKSRCQR